MPKQEKEAELAEAVKMDVNGGGQAGVQPVREVNLRRSTSNADPNLLLWYLIKKSTDSLCFERYGVFTDSIMCNPNIEKEIYEGMKSKRHLPYTDTDAYRLLKVVTEAFLVVNCGVRLSDDADDKDKELFGEDIVNNLDVVLTKADARLGPNQKLLDEWWDEYLKEINGTSDRTLPYLALVKGKLGDLKMRDQRPLTEGERLCVDLLSDKLANPCFIELIWSYWHEQGMLVQSMNALSRRFQNLRGPAEIDPLAMVETNPLRPLNNLLWGYVQDEQHRLSLVRRAYEYDHHYGLTLVGRAVPELRPADSRGRFLEAFHNLLHTVAAFYKQDDDTTVISDGFAVLNALKSVHILLSEGAHNQFGDLPFTARVEMLMQQWLLARPEFRELLPTRAMVANPEPWMDRVDAMKKLQGWDSTNVLHYHNLGVWGEQILLSVRFGSWSVIEDEDVARVWARFFRSQIKGYLHAYQTVTGVDLTADSVVQQRHLIITQPSQLIRRRLGSGKGTSPALPSPGTPAALPQPQGFRERRAARRLPSGSNFGSSGS
jgi:hypothetical protein